MKKYLVLLLILCLALAGCGRQSAQKEHTLSVVCTIFPCYDLARAVLGGEGEISMLISPGSEVHTYDPTPSDLLKIQNADVFVMIGGESEEWVNTILSSLPGGVRVARLMDCVDALQEELGEGMEEEEEEEESGEAEWDEHIWTSPRNMRKMLSMVTDALCEAAPEKAEVFRKNAGEYDGQLAKLDQDFSDIAASAQRKKLVFGDRFPFLYFVRAYGLSYAAAFPGCSSASEPSVSTVAALVSAIKEEDIPVVFQLELSSGRLARTLADETGAKVLTLHSCHNVTLDEFQSGETYVSLMQKNLQSLTEALN